jgi:hypothetical protein
MASRLIGIDDGCRGGQGLGGQVMIGDDHTHAQPIGFRHAFDAGDAIVHGDQQVRAALRRQANDFRRQTVAVLKSIRHQIIHARAECAQRANANRASRGAIRIVVGDDEQTLPGSHCIGQQRGCFPHALQRSGW